MCDTIYLTRWQQVCDPLFCVLDGNVEARADDTALVDAAVQLYDDLACAVVVDQLELTDVTWWEKGGTSRRKWCW